MNNFYLKLAVSNLKKNKTAYIPYSITWILSISVFFILKSMSDNESLTTLSGGYIMDRILTIGTVLVGVFSLLFLFYSSKILIRQRKKEIGLYNIFGLEKKHICKIISYELLMMGIINGFLGMIIGISFGKAAFLVLIKVVHLGYSIQFSIQWSTVITTTILCFSCIWGIILFSNIVTISKMKPIELLYDDKKGEMAPRFLLFKGICAVIFLGMAYYYMTAIPSPIDVIGRIFPISLLIIAGTILFFTAGTVIFLNMLKRNKKYYFSSRNFVSLAGLTYRVRQNAIGLALISILSAAALVIMTITATLYVGQKEIVDYSFPLDTKISIEGEADEKECMNLINETAKEYSIRMKRIIPYHAVRISAVEKKGVFAEYKVGEDDPADTCGIFLITVPEYNNIEKKQVELKNNEVMFFSSKTEANLEQISIGNRTYKVKEEIKKLSIQNKSALASESLYYIVVQNKEILRTIVEEHYANEDKSQETYNILFDSAGIEEDKFLHVLQEKLGMRDNKVTIENSRWAEESNYYTYGGFLFVGAFLGILFILYLALVIYYKQISEGYNDRNNFEIMGKVGLSKAEILKTIKKQIKKQFFLPLGIALIHLLVALNAISMLVATLGVGNTVTVRLTSLIIAFLFTVVYIAVYAFTAKLYYNIVTA